MEPVTFETLDTSRPDELERYERSLYRAFRATPSIVLEQIWNFDHKTLRVKARIPYSSQLVYIGRSGKSIIAGAAMNVDMSQALQLEMVGFSIDKTEPGVCEGLSLFTLRMFNGDRLIGAGLKEYAYPLMVRAGVRIIYGTCNKRRLRGYMNLGYEPVNEMEFDKGTVYLIRLAMPI